MNSSEIAVKAVIFTLCVKEAAGLVGIGRTWSEIVGPQPLPMRVGAWTLVGVSLFDHWVTRRWL